MLELSHPIEIFDGSLIQETAWDSSGQGFDEHEPTSDGTPGEIAMLYGTQSDNFDSIQQVSHK